MIVKEIDKSFHKFSFSNLYLGSFAKKIQDTFDTQNIDLSFIRKNRHKNRYIFYEFNCFGKTLCIIFQIENGNLKIVLDQPFDQGDNYFAWYPSPNHNVVDVLNHLKTLILLRFLKAKPEEKDYIYNQSYNKFIRKQ